MTWHAIVEGNPAVSDRGFVASEIARVENREKTRVSDSRVARQWKVRFSATQDALVRVRDTLHTKRRSHRCLSSRYPQRNDIIQRRPADSVWEGECEVCAIGREDGGDGDLVVSDAVEAQGVGGYGRAGLRVFHELEVAEDLGWEAGGFEVQEDFVAEVEGAGLVDCGV